MQQCPGAAGRGAPPRWRPPRRCRTSKIRPQAPLSRRVSVCNNSAKNSPPPAVDAGDRRTPPLDSAFTGLPCESEQSKSPPSGRAQTSTRWFSPAISRAIPSCALRTAACRVLASQSPATRGAEPGHRRLEDKPNFFDVTVFGTQGENCARFLSKGRPVAIDGRLDWREWEVPERHKRQALSIIAEAVVPGGRDDAGNGNGFTPRSDVPADRATSSPPPPRGRWRQQHRRRRRYSVLRHVPRGASPGGVACLSLPCPAVARASGVHPSSDGSKEVFEVAKQRSRPTRRRDRKGRARRRAPQVLPVLPRQGRVRRLQGHHGAAEVHLRPREDPLAADHRRVPPASRTRSPRPSSAPASWRSFRTSAIRASRRDDRDRDRVRSRPRPRPLGRHAPGHPPRRRGAARRARPGHRRLEGYLRNFLIPRKLAEPATKGSIEAARRAPRGRRPRGRRRRDQGARERRAPQPHRAHDLAPGGRGRAALRLGHVAGHRRRDQGCPRHH